LALRLEPTKDLTIDYAYDKSSVDETPPAASLLSSKGYGSLYPATTSIGGQAIFFQCLSFNRTTGACVFPGLGPAIAPYVNTSYPTSVGASVQLASSFGPNFQRLDLDGHSVIAEYNLGGGTTLRYIGAKRDMAYSDHTDTDGTPVLVFESLRTTDYSTTSHEVQLVGSVGGARYVGGLYQFKDQGTSLQRQAGDFYTFTPGNPNFRMSNFSLTTKAEAVYGQVDMDVGAFGIGVGGRYTKESKTVRAWRYNFVRDSSFDQSKESLKTLDVNGETSFSQFTPTFNLLYRLNKDTNLFGRVAKGFKSGGFPAEAPVTATSGPNKPFSPETSTSYEAGIKSSFLGGKGQFSANVFLTDVKDYQISLLPAGSTSPTIVNAGKLRTKGFELDASVTPMSGTRMTVAYGYLDAKFGEYRAFNIAGTLPVDAASNTVVSGAPRHTLSLSLDQRLLRTGSGMTLRGLADWRSVSDRYSYPGQINPTAANATAGNTAADSLRPALGTLDLKLVLNGIKAFGPGDFELAAWVKNATNEQKTIAHIDVGGFYQIGFWNDPRTYGLTLNYKW
jgi:iron complex outermembrane receptor protein